jgi:hypothetical protein
MRKSGPKLTAYPFHMWTVLFWGTIEVILKPSAILEEQDGLPSK